VDAATRALQRGLALCWSNHSERSTLPSALAAIGVSKEHRDLLGRWAPDGSDDYVRTYRAVARELVGRFVSTVKSGRSFVSFDEKDAIAEVGKKLTEKDLGSW